MSGTRVERRRAAGATAAAIRASARHPLTHCSTPSRWQLAPATAAPPTPRARTSSPRKLRADRAESVTQFTSWFSRKLWQKATAQQRRRRVNVSAAVPARVHDCIVPLYGHESTLVELQREQITATQRVHVVAATLNSNALQQKLCETLYSDPAFSTWALMRTAALAWPLLLLLATAVVDRSDQV